MAEPNSVLVVMALEAEGAGELERAGIPVLYTGVGKVNAAHALTRKLCELRSAQTLPELVVNFGTAGSRAHPPHTLVACRRFLQRDMDVRGLGFALGETPFETTPRLLEFTPVFTHLPEAVCGSADRFEMLQGELGCDVVDMEAYALAKVCRLEQLPFACAKFVTDGADGEAGNHWKENVSRAAAMFVALLERVT